MFIVFEGLDGSGKSTQIEILSQSLRDKGRTVIQTREPGGTPIGDAIRALTLGPNAIPMEPLTWAFLMNSARAELVANVIEPSVNSGDLILSDRYWYSTLAYQGSGDGVPLATIRELADISTGAIAPDLVLYLDVLPASAIRRKRAGALDVLDRRPLDFRERVRESYLKMVRADPGRWVLIDGARRVDEVASDILAVVLAHPAISHALSPA